MKSENVTESHISRRKFFGGSAAAAAACALAPGRILGAPAARRLNRPNSNFNGVRVGIIAPYAFRGTAGDAEDILERIVQLGLSYVEMQNGPVEEFAGVPQRSFERPPRGTELTDEQRTELEASQRAYAEEVRRWRLSVSMDPFRELRRMYEDAGVTIEIVKFGLGPDMSDDEVNYCFEVAKALGCRSITCEPPVSETKRLGEFAKIHRVMLGYHNHANATDVERFCRPGAWEQTFYYSPFNFANVDIGHFMAGNNYSAEDFIREYNTRITSLHLKDRKMDQGPNVPWGEGDTPIRETLQLLRGEQYHQIMATIELEYPIPDNSDVMTELAKCVQYCRESVT